MNDTGRSRYCEHHSCSCLKSHQELANRAGRRQAEGRDVDSFFATLCLFCSRGSLHSTISKCFHDHTGSVPSVPQQPLLVRVIVSSFQALAGTRLQVFIWLDPQSKLRKLQGWLWILQGLGQVSWCSQNGQKGQCLGSIDPQLVAAWWRFATHQALSCAKRCRNHKDWCGWST